MSTSQVPGPGPQSLGGQCLRVTTKPPAVQVSNQVTRSTPVHLTWLPAPSCCSSPPHSVRLGVFLFLHWAPHSLGLSPCHFLFAGVSWWGHVWVSHPLLCFTSHLASPSASPSSVSLSITLFSPPSLPLFQATHPHVFLLYFLSLLFNTWLHRTKYSF